MASAFEFSKNGETLEQWVPAGWQIAIPTAPNKTMIAYGLGSDWITDRPSTARL